MRLCTMYLVTDSHGLLFADTIDCATTVVVILLMSSSERQSESYPTIAECLIDKVTGSVPRCSCKIQLTHDSLISSTRSSTSKKAFCNLISARSGSNHPKKPTKIYFTEGLYYYFFKSTLAVFFVCDLYNL